MVAIYHGLPGNGKGFSFHHFYSQIILPVAWLVSASAWRAGRDDPAGKCPV
jgi:hypothetical protein